MQAAIIVIVVVAAALIGWWLVNKRGGAASSATATLDDFTGARAPTGVEIDGATAIVTFDLEVPEGGLDSALRELLVKQAREALRGKGVDVDHLSIRAWRGGHMTEIARTSERTARADDAGLDVTPEAADFDPLGELHNTDFGTAADVTRVAGELAPIGNELRLTQAVRDMLAAKAVDPSAMTMTEMTLALLDATGYTVSPGTAPGTYNASNGAVRTFITIVDHEKGAYPELEESTVNGFVIHFVSSGADRGLLFTDKYCPFVVYDKERREPRIRFITRERLQAFVDSVALR